MGEQFMSHFTFLWSEINCRATTVLNRALIHHYSPFLALVLEDGALATWPRDCRHTAVFLSCANIKKPKRHERWKICSKYVHWSKAEDFYRRVQLKHSAPEVSTDLVRPPMSKELDVRGSQLWRDRIKRSVQIRIWPHCVGASSWINCVLQG